jgi:hypothetical protein
MGGKRDSKIDFVGGSSFALVSSAESVVEITLGRTSVLQHDGRM